jgi:hypothetical protein
MEFLWLSWIERVRVRFSNIEHTRGEDLEGLQRAGESHPAGPGSNCQLVAGLLVNPIQQVLDASIHTRTPFSFSPFGPSIIQTAFRRLKRLTAALVHARL